MTLRGAAEKVPTVHRALFPGAELVQNIPHINRQVCSSSFSVSSGCVYSVPSLRIEAASNVGDLLLRSVLGRNAFKVVVAVRRDLIAAAAVSETLLRPRG
jgi:hypothetical protein